MNTRPNIIVVDDEPTALASLLDALTRRYGGDYRVIPHLSAPAILEGCAMGRLENYLHKPWSPPEVHLYPAVGEFLADWTRMRGPRMEIVRVLGEDPSPRAREIRDPLERNGIPHGFYPNDVPSDVRFVEGKEVFVAGAGNSTGQGVVHLARFARRVTLLVRGDSLEKHLSDYLVREIRNRPNVEVRLRAEAVEAHGDGQLERLTIADRERGLRETRPALALFVLIGVQPHTEWLADAVQRDATGFIATGADVNTEATDRPLDRSPARFETSMPGVFAAGDVRTAPEEVDPRRQGPLRPPSET